MRNRLYDEYCSRLLYEKCLEKPEALVMKVETRPKSKWRPSPLNTIELQKLASRKLHMSSSRVMEIAEKLYNKGFISYPRTVSMPLIYYQTNPLIHFCGQEMALIMIMPIHQYILRKLC